MNGGLRQGERSMDIQQIFRILGISETKEEERIKEAYRGRLTGVNPEDNPEGFRQLREAYEAALDFARERETDLAVSGDDPVSLFLKKAEEIYHSLPRRLDPGEWERLVQDPILDDLDLGETAKWRLFSFLASSYRLPSAVWRILDRCFGIRENRQEFKEHLTENFVDHMLYKCSEEGEDGEFPYGALEGGEGADFDGFLQQYFELVTLMKNPEKLEPEAWQKALEQKLVFLDTFGIGHPWYDLEKAKSSFVCGRQEEALQRLYRLWETCRDDSRTRSEGARLLLDCGREQEAMEAWTQLLERCDLASADRYTTSAGLAEICERRGDLWEARKYALQAGRLYHTQDIRELLLRIDEGLIAVYQQEGAPALSLDRAVLLAWCFNQTQREEEGWQFFEKNGLLDGQTPDCHKAKAVLAANTGRGRQAVEEARLWRGSLSPKEEDYEYSVAQSFHLEGRGESLLYEEQKDSGAQEAQKLAQAAIDAYAEAVRHAPEDVEFLMSEMLFFRTLERYEDMARVCERIREVDDSDYWACFYAQEAYEKLGRAQEVVDNYYSAREIYAGHPEIYERAVKVFLDYRQYGDARDILDQAQEAGVSSFALTVRQAELLQRSAGDEAAVKEAEAFMEKAAAEFEQKGAPDDLKADLYLRRAMLHDAHDIIRSEDGMCRWLCRSVELKDSALARYYLGRFYVEYKDDRKSAYEHLKAAEDQGMTFPWLYYYIARCHEDYARWDDAIEYYKKAAQADPEVDDFPWRVAWLYRCKFSRTGQQDYYREAVRWLELQEKKFGLVCRDLWQRALLLRYTMRYGEALEQIDLALENYHSSFVWGDKGLILDLLGRYQEAAECYEKGIDADREDGKDYEYGYSRVKRHFYRQKDFEGGLFWFQRRQPLLKTREQRRINLDNIRRFYLRLGELEKALDVVKESYGSSDLLAHACSSWKEEGNRISDILDSYEALASREVLEREAARAEALMEGPLADVLTDPGGRSRGWGEIAFAYTNCLLDDEKGFRCLQESLKYSQLEGDEAYAQERRDMLMRCAWRLGDLGRATAYADEWWDTICKKYNECAALGKSAEELHAAGNCPRRNLYDLFRRRFFTGDYEGAGQCLRQMEDAAWCWDCELKDCTEFWECKGYLLLQEGRLQEAQEAFERAQEASLYGNWDAKRELLRLEKRKGKEV